MDKYNWSVLNKLQVGKYSEYFVKMEFTLYGFDVYQAEVDDKGIDFVIRKRHDKYYDIQVKSVRSFNYIFFQKQGTSNNSILASLLVSTQSHRISEALNSDFLLFNEKHEYSNRSWSRG